MGTYKRARSTAAARRPAKRRRTFSNRANQVRRRRKMYRRRRRKSRALINPTVNRLINPSTSVLRQAYVKFYYDATVPLTPFNAASSSALDYFRANTIWDPYRGIGGTHCKGYPTLLPFYNRYTVLRCKIVVTFINDCPTSRMCWLQAALKDDDRITGANTYATLTERTDTKTSIMSGSGTPSSRRTLTYYMNIPKALQIDDDDPDLTANYASSGTLPETNPVFTVGVTNPPYATGDPRSVTCKVRVTYYTRLSSDIQIRQLG